MALQQEPLADSIERGDKSVRFEADAGEENGPYDPSVFGLEHGDLIYPGERMTIDGKTLTVYFPVELTEGDAIWA